MKKLILMMTLLTTLLTSCKDEAEIKKNVLGDFALNYISFGEFYFTCLPPDDCTKIYRMTSESLFEDEAAHYPVFNKPYEGNFTLLDDEVFEQVKDIEIPAALLQTDSGVIGAPDAADQGGIYIEVSVEGVRKFWLIDKNQSVLPEFLEPLISEIEEKIELINQ